jgi:hypothetical protein
MTAFSGMVKPSLVSAFWCGCSDASNVANSSRRRIWREKGGRF